MGGKQRQVVQQPGFPPCRRFAGFQLVQNLLRAGDHRRGQTRQFRHLHAIGPVGRPVPHLVQEHDLALEFLHRHGGVAHVFQLPGQCRHLVVMGGKDRAAAIDRVQVFHRGPCDGQPVIGRRAPPDFIEDHQSRRIGLVQDRGGFDHFHHERGPPARQVIGGAHPAEDLADDADAGLRGGHETAHLRKDHDQRNLPEIGGFAGHVGPGQKQDMGRILGGAELGIIRHESRPRGAQRGLDHRVTSAFDHQVAPGGDLRPNPVTLGGAFGKACGEIQFGNGAGQGGKRSGLGQNGGTQGFEDLAFQGAGPVGGVQDAFFELGQVQRGKPQRIGGRLAVDEGIGERLAQHPFGMGGRRFDEIAENVVVLDLQGPDPGRLDILRLQPGDHAAPFVAQLPRRIQIGGMAFGHHSAIAQRHGQVVGQCTAEQVRQISRALKRGGDPGKGGVPLPVEGCAQVGCVMQAVAHRTKIPGPAPVKR